MIADIPTVSEMTFNGSGIANIDIDIRHDARKPYARVKIETSTGGEYVLHFWPEVTYAQIVTSWKTERRTWGAI